MGNWFKKFNLGRLEETIHSYQTELKLQIENGQEGTPSKYHFQQEDYGK